MNDKLTYLTLKYGVDDFGIDILYEIPAELVFNAYRKYHKHQTFFEMDLTDSVIADRFSALLEHGSKGSIDIKFDKKFSKILLEEIKKYYEQTSDLSNS